MPSPLRADAAQNRDRLLDAAAVAFARDGSDASLKDIAREAGVGIGTLYRRFPTRASLVEATYRSETQRLVAASADLLAARTAPAALLAWFDLFVDYMASKHGMHDVLQLVLTADGQLRMQTRDLLTGAVETILAAGRGDGSFRPDADPNDVLMAVGGVALIAGGPTERELAHRLSDIIVRGLSPVGAGAAAAASATMES